MGRLANPIILEFAYGMALAWLWQRRWLDTLWAGPPLILAGLACLFLLPKAFMGHRFLSWGVPAAGLVAGMVCLEPILAPFVPRLLVALGDASYSIYLTHGFVLAGLAIFLHGTQVSGSAAAIAICAMAASAGFGWLVHILVEISCLSEARVTPRRRRGCWCWSAADSHRSRAASACSCII